MKIKMKVYISGTRDGESWPLPGEEIDVSDEEGATLCANGLADPVAKKGKGETATVKDDSEKRAKG